MSASTAHTVLAHPWSGPGRGLWLQAQAVRNAGFIVACALMWVLADTWPLWDIAPVTALLVILLGTRFFVARLSRAAWENQELRKGLVDDRPGAVATAVSEGIYAGVVSGGGIILALSGDRGAIAVGAVAGAAMIVSLAQFMRRDREMVEVIPILPWVVWAIVGSGLITVLGVVLALFWCVTINLWRELFTTTHRQMDHGHDDALRGQSRN